MRLTPPGHRRHCRIAVALGFVLIGGCSKPVAPPPASEAGATKASYIRVEAVTPGGPGVHGALPGRLAFRPDAMAAIGAPFAGRVVSVAVRPGQAVKAGTPLAVLQSVEVADARSALVQAEAKLAVAQDHLRRQADMIARGVGLEVDRYAAEVALREARAEVTRTRKWSELAGAGDGDRLTLRASSAGVVLAVHAQAGAVVAAGGDTLVEIGDPARLWVVADVPERELGDLAVGRSAQVAVPGIDAGFAMKVEGVGHALDAEQRRLPIYLGFGDGKMDPRLTAGMFARVQVEASGAGALTLPAAAVLIKDGASRQVYLQGADGKYVARPVRTGVSRAGRVEILEGVSAGDRVVVQGALLLDNEAEQLL